MSLPIHHATDPRVQYIFQESEKPCISMILPLHNSSFKRKDDELDIQHALEIAKDALYLKFPDVADKLITETQKLAKSAAFNKNDKGLGLYVTVDFAYHTTFPFTVLEKISVQPGFELIDMLFKLRYSFPYVVLVLTEESAQLYSGMLEELTELKTNEFPREFEDDYEYQPPARGTSYSVQSHVKDFERDKYSLQKERFENFLHYVDKSLAHQLTTDEVVIICGIRRHTSAFMNRSEHTDKIISVITGNYDVLNKKKLNTAVWSAIESYVAEKTIEAVEEYKDAINSGLADEGIDSVWISASEGRGAILLVEQDLNLQGFTDKKFHSQFYRTQQQHQCTEVANAANEVARTVLQKGGQVMVVENGILKNQGRIALMRRY